MSAMTCPHCGFVNEIRGARPGQQVACIACDGSFAWNPQAATGRTSRPAITASLAPPPSILASDRFEEPDANAKVLAALDRIEAQLRTENAYVKRLHWQAVFFAALWSIGAAVTAVSLLVTPGGVFGLTLGLGFAVAIVAAAVIAALRN